MIWISASLLDRLEDYAPAGTRALGGGRRAGSDDRVVSRLRVGEGVQEGGGVCGMDGCGSLLNSSGIGGRAGLRGVLGGGRDGLDL